MQSTWKCSFIINACLQIVCYQCQLWTIVCRCLQMFAGVCRSLQINYMNYECKLIIQCLPWIDFSMSPMNWMNNILNVSHESMNIKIDIAKSISCFKILLLSCIDRLPMAIALNIRHKTMTVRNRFSNYSNKYMICVHYTNYN